MKDKYQIKEKHLYCYQNFFIANDVNLFEIYYLVDKEGFFHHDTLPAIIVFINNNSYIFFYHHGILYKKDGPAQLQYLKNRNNFFYHQDRSLREGYFLLTAKNTLDIIKIENYFLFYLTNSSCHREDGPTIIQADHTGEILHSYIQKGKRHREDGAAKIIFDREGNIKESSWYLEDKMLLEEN